MEISELRKETIISLQKDLSHLIRDLGLTKSNAEILTTKCRLFVDSSSRNLKSLLLHNRNKYSSLPLAHSLLVKEDYSSKKSSLDALKHYEYGWDVIG